MKEPIATDMRRRVTALLIAAGLVGGAVVIRVWLAATGGYHAGGLGVALRAASAVALFAGLLLAALAVAWPLGKGASSGSEGPPSEAPYKE